MRTLFVLVLIPGESYPTGQTNSRTEGHQTNAVYPFRYGRRQCNNVWSRLGQQQFQSAYL